MEGYSENLVILKSIINILLYYVFFAWALKAPLKIVVKERFNGEFTTTSLRFRLDGS